MVRSYDSTILTVLVVALKSSPHVLEPPTVLARLDVLVVSRATLSTEFQLSFEQLLDSRSVELSGFGLVAVDVLEDLNSTILL
jgi:hypothetical protein